MGVRFILGRAGSGKTHHCVEAIRERLAASPVAGPRLVLLVPEQAALQVEREIIAPESVPGSHRAEVLSFRRLSHRIMMERPAVKRQALSETARAMLIRHIISSGEVVLDYYHRSGSGSGFVQEIGSAISELIQEDISPSQMLDVIEGTSESSDISSSQHSRIKDVAALFAAYAARLSETILDPGQFLALAREQLAQVDWLTRCEIWVDGFASFTRQESLTLVELARVAHSIDITVLVDPKVDTDGRPPFDIFTKTSRTQASLGSMLARAGVEIVEPLALSPTTLPRFHSSPAIKRIESVLAGDVDQQPDADPSSDVYIAELPSRRLEVEYAVAAINRLVSREESPLRYSEIAIIARDLDNYHDLIADALEARGIPYFVDRRRSMAHHALPELMRTLIAIALRDAATDDMRLALKTGLWPIAQQHIDELENHLLAHAVAGWRQWQNPFRRGVSKVLDENADEDAAQLLLKRLNETRTQIVELVNKWMNFTSSSESQTGKQWAQAIINVTNKIGCLPTVAAWANDAEESGRLDESAEHRRVVEECQAFLQDLVFALGDTPITLSELNDIVEAGLATVTLGVAPPMVDQILVGSIERSRHPAIKAALVVGFNDGIYPQYADEENILNDDDREMFAKHGMDSLPTSTQRTLDEPLLTYIALTRASQYVLLTYASGTDDGKALQPSPDLPRLLTLIPKSNYLKPLDPWVSKAMWDIQTDADLAARVACEMRSRGLSESSEQATRARWNNLYELARSTSIDGQPESDQSGIRRIFTSLKSNKDARLSPAVVRSLWDGPLATSISRLESFATCPFKFFSDSVLRLKERQGAILTPMDLGKVHHKILEDLAWQFADRKQRLDDLDEDKLLKELERHCQRIAGEIASSRTRGQSHDRYILSRAGVELRNILRAQHRIAAKGSARPYAAELAFGFDPKTGLPALTIETPKSREGKLRGFIDRVDIIEKEDGACAVVIDYKRSRGRRLDLSSVFHGLSLQLVAYMLVLNEYGQTKEGEPLEPVASLYVSLRTGRESIDHPEESKGLSDTIPSSLKPRGLIRADRFSLLEELETGRAQGYAVHIKKDGKLGNIDTTDAAEAEAFSSLLTHTRLVMGNLIDGILDGDIAVRPFRRKSYSPCTHCDFKSLCQFEMGVNECRNLVDHTRSQVFANICEDQGNSDST